MRFFFPLAGLLMQGLLTPFALADPVSEAETIYADGNDANSVLGAIDSGLFSRYRGKDRAAWDRELRDRTAQLTAKLATLSDRRLSKGDARVVAILKKKLKSLAETPASQDGADIRCESSRKPDLDYTALRSSLESCFTEIANNLEFEGARIDRASALGRLSELDETARRKALFYAFAPLWQAINGSNEPRSPYRRLISMAAKEGRTKESAVDAAARTAGVTSAQLEQWLVRILEAWSTATAGTSFEPWDYRYAASAAERTLAMRISRASMLDIDHRFYRDLGADLKALGVLYDLEPRPDKSSVAYTDFLIHGRWISGRWQPTIARVLASYSDGGLGSLNELVHENGHAVHISAIRNRPAYVDWNEDLFVEAFADVSSWSIYEPSWQRRYLGAAAPQEMSQRALFASVMLDVAWALFEARLLHDPTRDPNVLWTQITQRYLHIAPHPEIAWWAVRVQLAEAPGYMVNYGLGAVLTADLRQRVSEKIGPFDAGNPRWYPWLSQNLLRFGSERDTPTLLREFLGRPVSPDALLAQIRRSSVAGRSPPSR